ncbi:hypothetical protein GCM10027046_30940 [Uliginosibacterium flavum]
MEIHSKHLNMPRSRPESAKTHRPHNQRLDALDAIGRTRHRRRIKAWPRTLQQMRQIRAFANNQFRHPPSRIAPADLRIVGSGRGLVT